MPATTEKAVESLDDILNVAKEAAILAGSHIRKAYETSHNDITTEINDDNDDGINATIKSSSTDLVTETDKLCEKVIIQHIQSIYSSHEIIGEESSGSNQYILTDKPTWVLDPIDGTTNFVHKLSLSCVIVAFVLNKEVCVGVVYDPISDEMFWAIKGRGAFLQRFASSSSGDDATSTTNNLPIPIHVSSTKSISKALIATDPGYSRDVTEVTEYLAVQRELLLRNVRNIRTIGSTGLNMAYVSCGRLDASFEEGSWETNRGPKIWDIAAGSLLVSEAGGVTRDLNQSALPTDVPLDLLQRSNFCAATTGLAEEIMDCIKSGRLSKNTQD